MLRHLKHNWSLTGILFKASAVISGAALGACTAGLAQSPYAPMSSTAQSTVVPAHSTSVMAGTWVVTIGGKGPVYYCSSSPNVTIYLVVTLSASGTGVGAESDYSSCGRLNTPQTLQLLSVARNGSGNAILSCGAGCINSFNIQVAKGNNEFSMISSNNTYLVGTAIRQ